VELAKRYLTRCLKFKLDEQFVLGIERFQALLRAFEGTHRSQMATQT
jgi:hypothetical protein